MTLSVIVPDDRPGMLRMLDHELKNIDSEIIHSDWRLGLKKAQGDFICLMEHDSAVQRGSMAKQMEFFEENPNFCTIAMVSPQVQFENSEPLSLLYHGESRRKIYSTCHLVKVGCVGGAIIRANSLRKFIEAMDDDIIEFSYNLSLKFWENGLRIMREPNALYESPTEATTEIRVEPTVPLNLMELWTRECVV